MQQVSRPVASYGPIGSAAIDELKERIKKVKSLEVLSKDETLKLRLQHVG